MNSPMKFMDLLFKRYASPFSLLDEVIRNRQLCEFIKTFAVEVENDQLWEFFLHKVNGQTFEEFKGSIKPKIVTEADLETTVTTSYNIIQNFNPI